jgi:hypothetical protein
MVVGRAMMFADTPAGTYSMTARSPAAMRPPAKPPCRHSPEIGTGSDSGGKAPGDIPEPGPPTPVLVPRKPKLLEPGRHRIMAPRTTGSDLPRNYRSASDLVQNIPPSLGRGDMKKTERKAATAKQTSSGPPGRPTKKRLTHIARDVMAQERRARRSLDQQAERAAKAKRKKP